MRGEIPDGGKPVAERDTESASYLSKDFTPDKELLGTEIGAADGAVYRHE